MRNKLFFFAFGCAFFLSAFTAKPSGEKFPKTITRTSTLVNGATVEKTVILLDGNTSREELIHTCNFLAQENVQLTFDKLSIGRSFLGVAGKQRIRIAKGKIELANGTAQGFKAGGLTGFRFLKIQYSKNLSTAIPQMEMIEIVH
jgi:hypothetical protein